MPRSSKCPTLVRVDDVEAGMGTVRGGRLPVASGVAPLVLAALFWAASVSGTKVALDGFGPITLLGVELTAAAVTLWVVVAVRGRRPGIPWRYALALGLLEPCLAYAGETVGLRRTTAANASVLAGLEAVFVVALAAFILRERITLTSGSAVLLGLLGLVGLESAGGLHGPGIGDALVLCGALCAAFYTIVARHIETTPRLAGVDALTLTAQQFTVAAAAAVPCAVLAWISGLESVPRHASPQLWLLAVAIGVIGFGASFLLYNRAIAVVAASTSAIVLNLIPVFGLAIAAAWLGERLGPGQLIGAGLIMTSIGFVAWNEYRDPAVVITVRDAAVDLAGAAPLVDAAPARVDQTSAAASSSKRPSTER